MITQDHERQQHYHIFKTEYILHTLYDQKYQTPQRSSAFVIDVTVRSQTDTEGGRQVHNNQCKMENVKWRRTQGQ